MQEARGQRAVGAGAQLQVDVGQAGHGGGDARVDHDELAAALLVLHHLAKAVGLRPGGVERPHQGARRGVAGVGAHGEGAHGEPGADPGGGGAGRALGAVAGRAEERGHAGHGAAGLLGVAAVKEHLLGAVLLLHAVELARDALVGLLPGNLLPLGRAGALLVGSHHGRGEAVRVVELLQARETLGADGRRGVLVARLHAHNLAVFHGGGDAALGHVVAHVTVGVAHLFGGVCGNGALGVADGKRTGRAGAGSGGAARKERAARDLLGGLHGGMPSLGVGPWTGEFLSQGARG